MNYGEIKTCDIANGEGIRVSLFVSGCRHHCPGCFNSETWDFGYGNEFTEETEQRIFSELSHEYVDGLTVLGGEPFEPENQKVLLPFLEKVRSTFPEKNIWCYTGFTLETLTSGKLSECPTTAGMLASIDVLVDGPFVQEKKNISLAFRGSENQRILELRKPA